MLDIFAIISFIITAVNRNFDHDFPKPTPFFTPTPTIEPSNPSPTILPSPTTRVVPTSPPLPTASEFNLLPVYPRSTLIGGNEYKSEDSLDTVLGWYKEKIEEIKPSTKTIVKNAVNGKSTAIISLTVGSKYLTVNLSQENSNSPTIIEINSK